MAELDRLLDKYGETMMRLGRHGLRGREYVEAREAAIAARNALRDFVTDSEVTRP